MSGLEDIQGVVKRIAGLNKELKEILPDKPPQEAVYAPFYVEGLKDKIEKLKEAGNDLADWAMILAGDTHCAKAISHWYDVVTEKYPWETGDEE